MTFYMKTSLILIVLVYICRPLPQWSIHHQMTHFVREGQTSNTENLNTHDNVAM